jgi:hypothetical protein
MWKILYGKFLKEVQYSIIIPESHHEKNRLKFLILKWAFNYITWNNRLCLKRDSLKFPNYIVFSNTSFSQLIKIPLLKIIQISVPFKYIIKIICKACLHEHPNQMKLEKVWLIKSLIFFNVIHLKIDTYVPEKQITWKMKLRFLRHWGIFNDIYITRASGKAQNRL